LCLIKPVPKHRGVRHHESDHPRIVRFTTPVDPTSGDIPGGVFGDGGYPLTDGIRQGARTLLGQAVEVEVAAWIEGLAHITNEHSHGQV
jgi:hypothetical protein